MLRHLISHYKEANGTVKVVSWMQIDFFKWYWIFSKKEIVINGLLEQYKND